MLKRYSKNEPEGLFFLNLELNQPRVASASDKQQKKKLSVVDFHSKILEISGIFQFKHSLVENRAFSSEQKAPETLLGWLKRALYLCIKVCLKRGRAAVSIGASAPAGTCRYVLWLDTITEQPAEVSTRAPRSESLSLIT